MKSSAYTKDTVSTHCGPIFVIGHYRSGTTWLANILEAHPEIYTPTHPACNGQCESAFFSSLLPYCSWGRTKQDRIAMRAIFECSDYWHHLFPQSAPEIDAVNQAPALYFRECMDLAARRRNCTYWLEKTPANTLLVGYLIDSYPDACFIAVERNNHDVVRSYMHLSADKHSTLDWAKRAFMAEVYGKIITRYKSSIIKVNYDDIVSHKARVMKELYDAIGLPTPESDENRWAANSSFKAQKPDILLRRRAVISLVSWMTRLIPTSWCEWFGLRRFEKTNNVTLPGWMFRVFDGLFGGQANRH